MGLRPAGFKPDHKDVNLILLDGGIGDHIAALPAIHYMRVRYPYINFLIWVPDCLVDFAKNVLPPKSIVRSYTTMRTLYDRLKPTMTTQWDHHTSPMKMHPTDYAFIKLCDELPSISHKNYLKIQEDKIDLSMHKLPSNYAVICPLSVEKVKSFDPTIINGLIDYLCNKRITPVFIGSEDVKTGQARNITSRAPVEVNYHLGINLINKTNLLQAAKIMQHSKVVLAMDGGLVHVAGCTDAPIVAGYTFVDPMTKAPVRNSTVGHNCTFVVPPESLACRYCQSNTNFIFDHDYRDCFYKDFQCVKDITLGEFTAQLDKLFS
jgi:hypothetical protein